MFIIMFIIITKLC